MSIIYLEVEVKHKFWTEITLTTSLQFPNEDVAGLVNVAVISGHDWRVRAPVLKNTLHTTGKHSWNLTTSYRVQRLSYHFWAIQLVPNSYWLYEFPLLSMNWVKGFCFSKPRLSKHRICCTYYEACCGKWTKLEHCLKIKGCSLLTKLWLVGLQIFWSPDPPYKKPDSNHCGF